MINFNPNRTPSVRGESCDAFGRCLAVQPKLSECIEACMEQLAGELLDATLIENDDPSEEELLTAVAKASLNLRNCTQQVQRVRCCQFEHY